MPRCRPKDNTDKFGENSNITLIQIEYLILGMPKLSHTERYLRNSDNLCIHLVEIWCPADTLPI